MDCLQGLLAHSSLQGRLKMALRDAVINQMTWALGNNSLPPQFILAMYELSYHATFPCRFQELWTSFSPWLGAATIWWTPSFMRTLADHFERPWLTMSTRRSYANSQAKNLAVLVMRSTLTIIMMESAPLLSRSEGQSSPGPHPDQTCSTEALWSSGPSLTCPWTLPLPGTPHTRRLTGWGRLHLSKAPGSSMFPDQSSMSNTGVSYLNKALRFCDCFADSFPS